MCLTTRLYGILGEVLAKKTTKNQFHNTLALLVAIPGYYYKIFNKLRLELIKIDASNRLLQNSKITLINRLFY